MSWAAAISILLGCPTGQGQDRTDHGGKASGQHPGSPQQTPTNAHVRPLGTGVSSSPDLSAASLSHSDTERLAPLSTSGFLSGLSNESHQEIDGQGKTDVGAFLPPIPWMHG